jgi:hypothetical protein
MPRHIQRTPHLTVGELERRYRGAQEPHERSWFQILWLLSKEQTATTIAENTGYTRYWIGEEQAAQKGLPAESGGGDGVSLGARVEV